MRRFLDHDTHINVHSVHCTAYKLVCAYVIIAKKTKRRHKNYA